MNVVVVSGRLVRDGVLKNTGDTFIYNNSVAVKRDYQENGEYKADFIDISAFGSCATYMNEHIHKGDLVIIQGILNTNMYNDKNGIERKSVCIKINKINLVSKKIEDAEVVENTSDEDTPF